MRRMEVVLGQAGTPPRPRPRPVLRPAKPRPLPPSPNPSHIDEGANPDAYTSEVFARGARANQLAKGKAAALGALRDSLLAEAKALFPDAAAAYARLGEEAGF